MADSITQLTSFMAAIRRNESGSFGGNYSAVNRRSGAYGAYQFLPKYWDWYARSAGYPNADIRDRNAQDKVAEYHFRRLFNKYRNWDLVSIAWHGGEGRIPQYHRGVYHASDGYIQKMRAGLAEASQKFTPTTNVADRAEREAIRHRQQWSPTGVIEDYYTDTSTQPQAAQQQQVIDANANLLAEILGLLGDDSAQAEEEVDEGAIMRRNLSNMLTSLSNGIAGGNRLNVGAQVEVPTLQMDQATTGEGD